MGSSPALQSKSLERGEEKAASCSFPEGGEKARERILCEGREADGLKSPEWERRKKTNMSRKA